MELEGTIKRVLEQENISDNFSKKSIVLNTGGDYAQDIRVDFVNKNIQALNNVSEGEEVKIQINIRGREVSKKDGSGVWYAVSIDGWKLESLSPAEANAGDPFAVTPDDIGF